VTGTSRETASSRKKRDVTLITLAGFALVALLVAAGEPDNVFLRGAQRPRSVLNIAHAGAASLAPQNTLAAGRKALQAGADLWGVDVRLTRDGDFVLMHDATLERTTNVADVFPDRPSWRVEDFTVSELKELDAGSWFVATDPFGRIESGEVPEDEREAYVGEKIPTLAEALEFTRRHDWRIDIEVKAASDVPAEEIAVKLVALIEQTGTQDRVLVSSFDHRLLAAIERLGSGIPIGVLVIVAPWNPIEYLEALGADVYAPSPVGFTPDLVARLGALGFGVHLWTYNDERQMRRFAVMEGVSGIYTDFPQRLEPVLVELFGAKAGGG